MIIGVTGTLCAGKSTAVGVLTKEGFNTLSLSDFLRERCAKKGLAMDHDSLHACANELRAKFGPVALVEEALNRIDLEPGDYVVDALLTKAEVMRLQQEKHAFVIGVDADPNVRYGRARDRQMRTGRQENAASKEEFFAHEVESDRHSPDAVEVADVIVDNSGTVETLRKDILAALETFRRDEQPSSDEKPQ